MCLNPLAFSFLASAALAQQVQNLNAALTANDTSQLAILLGSYPRLADALQNAQNVTVLAPSI